MFDLDQDIGEKRDLSSKQPERLRAMVAEAEKWSRHHTQPKWFDSLKAEAQWKAAGMPKYDATFHVK